MKDSHLKYKLTLVGCTLNIWNPDHLALGDRIGQNGTYMSEHDTALYVHVQPETVS